MIIKISQTASNIKQTYDIDGEGFYYQGESGNVSRFQPITLYNKENVIKGVCKSSNWVNYIPFRYLFGKTSLTRLFYLYRNENIYGNIVFSRQGYMKSCYIIALDSGETFYCYCRSIASFDYVSIYHNDKQIGLIETYLNVNDYKYTHKLYVLDDYNCFAETLSFFVLYYASFTFVERFHMGMGSTYTKAWSCSEYNDKYDSEWREKNFPNENFFGKLNVLQ